MTVRSGRNLIIGAPPPKIGFRDSKPKFRPRQYLLPTAALFGALKPAAFSACMPGADMAR
jgi:hypothetical protein